MLYLDQKYLGLVSSRLRNYRRTDRNLYQFSCPVCGDSKKDSRKARCYAFEADDHMRVFCHKCTFSKSMAGFIKQLDGDLYREYLLERFEDKRPVVDYDALAAQAAEADVPRWFASNPLGLIDRLSDLPPDHAAVTLARRRGIPEERWTDLYHSDHFPQWANSLVPDKYGDMKDHARFVIPCHNRAKELVGFQGRAYDPKEKSKYLTASLDKRIPLLYNWDKVTTAKRVIVVEGPFDSMFLDNAIATLGGSLTRPLEVMKVDRSGFVVAYDNEPRGRITIDKVRQAAQHFPVFIWPTSVYDKDFNDMHLRLVSEGKTPERARELIMEMVRSRTFDGLEAELEITLWSRL